MTGAKPLRFEQGNPASRIQARYRRHRAAQQQPGNRAYPRWFSLCSYALVFGLGLSVAAAVQAQTPGEDFRVAIYGPNFDGNPEEGSICGRLNTTIDNPSESTQDLIDRCNGLAPTQQPEALEQVASEEVATQATNSTETSNQNIGARLAAVRAGATGINLQRFALNIDGQPLPGTLVASLFPIAAVSSAVPANTPSPFSRLGLFANGTFSWGDKDTTSNESGFDFDTYGVTAGADYRFTNNFVLGVAFSYQSIDADLDRTDTIGVDGTVDGGSVDTDAYTLSIYGTYYVKNFYIDSIASFGWNDYDIDRNIIYNNSANNPDDLPVNQTANGDTDGNQYSFSFGIGYDFTFGGLTLGPVARVNYIKIDIDGYREKIDNTDPGFGWTLNFDSQNVVSLTSVFGGQASYAISTGYGVWLPQIRFEWLHEFENDRRTITTRFVNDPEGQEIRYSTDSPDRDFVTLGASLSAVFRGGVSAFVDYETVLALDDVTRHDITLGVRIEL